MTDESATLHVVFGMAAAGSIREALTSAGRRERVIGCPDDLSFGPINPPSSDLRRPWAAFFLNYEFDETVGMAEIFWGMRPHQTFYQSLGFAEATPGSMPVS